MGSMPTKMCVNGADEAVASPAKSASTAKASPLTMCSLRRAAAGVFGVVGVAFAVKAAVG